MGAELLPVRYFHLVFTLPKPIADIAHQNKREIYNLLMRASADTLLRIASDPKPPWCPRWVLARAMKAAPSRLTLQRGQTSRDKLFVYRGS